MNFKYSLEKYRDHRSRHRCPACNAPAKFTRYIDNETGEYLADDVGICDRASKCRYHRTPREHFADNPNARPKTVKPENKRGNGGYVQTKPLPETFDTIPPNVFRNSIGDYQRNDFVTWLLSQFEEREVEAMMRRYFIGTWTDGQTIFWQLDEFGRVRSGKFMRYDRETGKRSKKTIPNWIHAVLKKQNGLPAEWTGEQCFFGEHLLSEDGSEEKAVAVVESAKTAIVASVFLPDFIWLSTEGKTNQIPRKLQTLWQRESVVLFPDGDAYPEWTRYAAEAAANGVNVTVSDLIETFASPEEKANGFDLADYLLDSAWNELRSRNQIVQTVFANCELVQIFDEICAERAAIMEIDGGLSREAAFEAVARPENLLAVAAALTNG